MEESTAGPNYEKDVQDIVEGLKNLECVFILKRYNNYIHQTKHGGLCGYKNLV